MSTESKDELRKRIAELESELQYYQDIAALYRASLGDVKANGILRNLPTRRKRHEEDDEEETDWKSTILERLQTLTTPQP